MYKKDFKHDFRNDYPQQSKMVSKMMSNMISSMISKMIPETFRNIISHRLFRKNTCTYAFEDVLNRNLKRDFPNAFAKGLHD